MVQCCQCVHGGSTGRGCRTQRRGVLTLFQKERECLNEGFMTDQYLSSVLTDGQESGRERKEVVLGQEEAGARTGISMAGLEGCKLFIVVGAQSKWGW